MALSRDAILAADDLPRKEVEVPEWGGTLWVRSLSALELERYTLENEGKSGVTICARLVALVACDVEGKRLFTNEEADKLAGKNFKSISRVYDVAAKLSGIPTSEEETKAAVKNSATTTADSSS